MMLRVRLGGGWFGTPCLVCWSGSSEDMERSCCCDTRFESASLGGAAELIWLEFDNYIDWALMKFRLISVSRESVSSDSDLIPSPRLSTSFALFPSPYIHGSHCRASLRQ